MLIPLRHKTPFTGAGKLILLVLSPDGNVKHLDVVTTPSFRISHGTALLEHRRLLRYERKIAKNDKTG